MEKTEEALAVAKAREAELSHSVKASMVEVNVAEDQVQISFACVLSVGEERQRKVVLSEETRADAWKRLHQDMASKIKELENYIGKLGNLQ